MDGSIEIIKSYQTELAVWISEADKGVYDAMNKAVTLARGQWLYFLGADDHLLDGFETAMSCLKDKTTLYYGNVYRPIADRIYDGKFSTYKLACRNICHQSIFYPACVWDKYAYNLKYPFLADYEFNLRCFVDPSIKFQYLPITIAYFNDEGGLSATQIDIAFEKDKLKLLKEGVPFGIYLLIFVRLFLLKILSVLKFKNMVTTIYHTLLR